MKKVLSALVLAVFLPTVVAAANKDKEEFRRSYELSSTGKVEVRNVNGDITIEGWSRSQVDLVAVKKGDPSDFDQVQIEVEETSEYLRVSTKYPRRKNHLDVSVEYKLKVPFDSQGEYSTVNGGVSITGVRGTLDASVVNGTVDVSEVRSSLEAETVNGTIHIRVADLKPGSRISMETVNGSMDLSLPENANANLDVRSMNGGISTDFPITVRGSFGSRKLEGQIGSGGAQIDIKSVNGGIRIRKTN